MWYKEAYYEIISPEKDELLSMSEKLDKKINNNSPLQKSIDKINKKIKESKTWIERDILEEQINELEKINEFYTNSLKKNITKNTKNKIFSLINDLDEQINLKENIINDDYQKLKQIINTEENKLKDTIDIISANTIRDTVENNINILWIKESITSEKYQEFFDIATVTYIDFLEKITQKKLTKAEENWIINNDWLYLDKEELQIFIWELFNKVKEKEIDFDFQIKLKKWEYEKTFLVNLKEYKDILDKKNKNEEIKEKIRSEKIKEKLKTKKFEDNMDNLSTKERMDYIEKILDNEEFQPFLLWVINKIEWKTIYLQNNKKIRLTKDYIEKNYDDLSKNLKSLILLIIEIESNWYSKAQNPISSAEWLWQWLSWNWRMSTEYMYNKKWYTKKLKNRKTEWVRNVWLTSSFETTLRNIKNSYPDKLLENLDFIPDKFNKKLKLRPIDLDLREQIKLLILDLWSNPKKVRNWTWNLIWIKDYLWTAILWNKWAASEIYKIFHHTSPDKNTLDRINEIIWKYDDSLDKVS